MNKAILYLFFLGCSVLFFSCAKEYSIELGKLSIAGGSLWDSSGNCLPETVHGTFYNGVIAGPDTAYVEVQVNVTETGSYSFTTDVQNGFQFFDSGFFSNTGLNTIRLKPVGAAIIPGPTTFSISFDTSFCSFTVNVQDSTGTGLGNQNAQGSLWDSTGSCLGETVFGTFYNGVTPGSDTAYVQVQVDVTQPGAYTISSDLQNGLQFVGSGNFTTTGLTTINLQPVGTPILPIASNFNISFGNSNCSFTVNVQDSTGTGLGGGTGGGNWSYKQSSFTYAGTFTTATKNITSGITFLNLSGATSTGDTVLSLQFLIPQPDITTGTYTLIANGIMFSVIDVPNGLTTLAAADGVLTTGSDMTINVTSYDAATGLMQGTFSGTVKDKSGNLVPLTNGTFSVTVQ